MKNIFGKFDQRKLTAFSSRPHLNKLATLLFIIDIELVILIVNSCNVHALYKMIFSSKLNLFWTASLFLCMTKLITEDKTTM